MMAASLSPMTDVKTDVKLTGIMTFVALATGAKRAGYGAA
jgi:hypothetical protein